MNQEKSLILTSNEIHKIYTVIYDQKSQNIKIENIKELEILKSICLTENVEAAAVACHAFVNLVEEGVIEPAYGISSFMSMLSISK